MKELRHLPDNDEKNEKFKEIFHSVLYLFSHLQHLKIRSDWFKTSLIVITYADLKQYLKFARI